MCFASAFGENYRHISRWYQRPTQATRKHSGFDQKTRLGKCFLHLCDAWISQKWQLQKSPHETLGGSSTTWGTKRTMVVNHLPSTDFSRRGNSGWSFSCPLMDLMDLKVKRCQLSSRTELNPPGSFFGREFVWIKRNCEMWMTPEITFKKSYFNLKVRRKERSFFSDFFSNFWFRFFVGWEYPAKL